MPFNPKEELGVYNTLNSTHQKMVLEKAEALKKAYAALSRTDEYVLGGGVTALIGAIPLLPFTWFIAVSGAVVCTWNLKGRSELSRVYQDALEEAVTVYNWCFDGTDVTQVLRYKELQDLTLLLAPLLPTKDWMKWERQKLLEIASTEKIAEKLSRQMTHAARGTLNSFWEKGKTLAGLGSEEQAGAKSVSDDPCSIEENAVFIAKVDGFAKTNTLGQIMYKVYGYKQSLNPLSLFSLTGQAKDKIVKEGMKAAAKAMAPSNP